MQIDLPQFAEAFDSSQIYRQIKIREPKFLKDYYLRNFLPYIENIIRNNPGITYEELNQKLKLDVTELNEAIFEASNTYHNYLQLLVIKYFEENPDKIEHYVELSKDPKYDSFEKVHKSEYEGTFEGDILNYLHTVVPTYEEELAECIKSLPKGYYDKIQEDLHNKIPPKTILNNISKNFKVEYSPNYLATKNFNDIARMVIYEFPEYLKTDKEFLKKDIKTTLVSSISKLDFQLEKFGFIEKAKRIRRNQLSRIGLSELSKKLDKMSSNPNEFQNDLNSLSLGNLLAYNVFYTNRYSKEADILSKAFFTAFQCDLLHKMLDPEINRFFEFKDRIANHTETDYSVIYNNDSTTEYPNKEDLYRIMGNIYPVEADYSRFFSTKVTNLVEARRDSSKVSVPGLLYEIKEIYPTREDFERAMSKVEEIFPSDEQYEMVLSKMSFLHVPVTQILEEIQSQVYNNKDSFDTHLSEEDELRIFGNVSKKKGLIRYSHEPYAEDIGRVYGEQYKKAFKTEDDLEPNIIDDANKYFRIFTPVYYSYEFKNDALIALLSVIKDENEFKNAGIIVDGINEEGTNAKLKYVVGIGIDPNLTSAIQLHYNIRNLLDNISQYFGDTKFPVYEGMEDFYGVSNQIIRPFSKDIEKYLKKLAKDPNLCNTAKNYVARIYSLATGRIPDHLCEEVQVGNGKKKKLEFNRKYVDIRNGNIYKIKDGEYVPIEPIKEQKRNLEKTEIIDEGDDFREI